MKPLSEWTEQGLTSATTGGDRLLGEILAELLRREREAMKERCAKAVEAEAEFWDWGRDPRHVRDIVALIRELQ